jgi:hypothetical protein
MSENKVREASDLLRDIGLEIAQAEEDLRRLKAQYKRVLTIKKRYQKRLERARAAQ